MGVDRTRRALRRLDPGLFDDGIARGIQAAHLIDAESDVEGRDVLAELLGSAAGNDRQDGRGALPHPGNDGLRRSASHLAGYRP